MIKCTICEVRVDQCQCADIDERLRDIARTSTFVAMKWCRTCDKHYGRCQCPVPCFYLVQAGEDITRQFPHVDLTTR